MELLEREEALAGLGGALSEARGGGGLIAFVSGEAGIGKTSLLRAFVAGVPDDVRLVIGGCDDLAVPRALGPFHEIADGLPALARRLDEEPAAAPRLVLEELRRTPALGVRRRGRALGRRGDPRRARVRRSADRGARGPARRLAARRRAGRRAPAPARAGRSAAGPRAPRRAGAPERGRGAAAGGAGCRCAGAARGHGRQPVLRDGGDLGGHRPQRHAARRGAVARRAAQRRGPRRGRARQRRPAARPSCGSWSPSRRRRWRGSWPARPAACWPSRRAACAFATSWPAGPSRTRSPERGGASSTGPCSRR